MAKEPLLDLHGYKTSDVTMAVDRFLVRSMSAGHKRVKIMPGKGTGQVRKIVVDYLKLGGYPFEFERMANGQRNEGCMIVFLDD